MAMFWFLIFNSFDATYLFEYTFVLLYNLIFTSLPVGIMGAFDQDANAKVSMVFPQLYKRGIQGLDYTRGRFWLYMFDGLYQSVILFFIPFLVYGGGDTWSSSGKDTNGLYDLGTTIAAAGVFAANLYIGINTRYWTFITFLVITISILLVFLWIPIYSGLASLGYYGEVAVLFTTFNFWATVFITVFLAVAPRFIISSARQSYWPRDKDIVREAVSCAGRTELIIQWVGGDLKAQLGIRHRRDPAVLEEQRTFANHLLNKLGEDERGAYQATAIASPRKQSPVSEVEGNRFAYPPLSPIIDGPGFTSPTRSAFLPPLITRNSSEMSTDFPSLSSRSQAADPASTPHTDFSYASPSALDSLTTPTGNRHSTQRLPIHPQMPRNDTQNSSIPLITPITQSSSPNVDIFASSFTNQVDLDQAYHTHRTPNPEWNQGVTTDPDFGNGVEGWEDDKRKSTSGYTGYAM